MYDSDSDQLNFKLILLPKKYVEIDVESPNQILQNITKTGFVCTLN